MPNLTDIPTFDDFELPPLPAKPIKKAEGNPFAVDEAPAIDKDIDSALPPLPEKTVDNSVTSVEEPVSNIDDELPSIPSKTIDDSVSAINTVSTDSLPETAVKSDPDALDTINTPVLNDEDYELPPVPAAPKKESTVDEDIFIIEENEKDDETEKIKEAEEQFIFDDDYDMDLDSLSKDSIVLEDMATLSDLTTPAEHSTKNIKEKIKLDDLAMEVGNSAVLDDLSDDYQAPQQKAVDLLEKETLKDDEKRVLKQRLEEDLQKLPENFNQKASIHMYNRLMEEKKMKIAKKGFGVSLGVIALGFVSAAISFLFLEWGGHNWFDLCAIAMVIASLILFIKSHHAKILSQLIYFLGIVAYLGPGLAMYILDPNTSADSDYGTKLTMFGVAAVVNILCLVILTKSESLNTYYTAKFSGKSGGSRR